MIRSLHYLRKTFLPLRYSIFIILLLCGNFHQANQKSKDHFAFDQEFFLEIEPEIVINKNYQSYLEENLNHILSSRSFNGSVLLAHKGEVVYKESFGKADFRKRIPLKEEDNVFQLASLSKQFTAIATLILYEKEEFDLDDKVNMYIKGFPYEDITIRHLLHHTSGLQNYMYLIDNFWNKEYLPDFDDMLQMFIDRDVPLNFTPGRLFSYSNSGYAFLAMLVEKVSGIPFADFVEKNIFEVAEMENSFVFRSGMDIAEKVVNGKCVSGHEGWGRYRRVIPVDYIDGITGDKGVFSSAEDLLKWNKALVNYKIIDKETLDLAYEPGTLNSGRKINYAMGYRLKNLNGHKIVYHHGWWRGFRNAYVNLPDDNLLIILNNTNASVNYLDNRIARVIDNCPYPPVLDDGQNNGEKNQMYAEN